MNQDQKDWKNQTGDSELLNGLVWSVGVHVGLFVFALFFQLLFPPRFEKMPTTLRVDLVGLPDQLTRDLPKSSTLPASETAKPAQAAAPAPAAPAPPKEQPTPKPSPKPSPPPRESQMAIQKEEPKVVAQVEKKPEPKPEPDPTPDRQSQIGGALARMRALERVREETQTETAPFRGNQISGGSSLASDAQIGDLPSYAEEVREALRRNWSLPVWLSRQDLSANAIIRINSLGHVTRIEFTQSSGNDQFDAEIRRAIQASQPLPLPAGSERSSVLSNGILLGFPL
jgi:TonB family protein